MVIETGRPSKPDWKTRIRSRIGEFMKWFKKEEPVTNKTINDLVDLDEDGLKKALDEIDDVAGMSRFRANTVRCRFLWNHIIKMSVVGLAGLIGVNVYCGVLGAIQATGLLDVLVMIAVIFVSMFSLTIDDTTYETITGQSIQARSLETILGINKYCTKHSSWQMQIEMWANELKMAVGDHGDKEIFDRIKDNVNKVNAVDDNALKAEFLKTVLPLKILMMNSHGRLDGDSYEQVMEEHGVRRRLNEINDRLSADFKSRESGEVNEIIMAVRKAQLTADGKIKMLNRSSDYHRIVDSIKMNVDNSHRLNSKLEALRS